MNIKVLPVGQPDITAYPHHAHLFSILNGIDEQGKYKLPWLCNNYIQLEYESGNIDFSIGYDILPILENCAWLVKDSISFEMIKKKWSDVVGFIVDAIDTGHYVYMEVDEYYIREYDNYNKKHLSHTILIYGYNEISKEFFVADFFKNRKYYFAKATFEEVKKGYDNAPTTFLQGIFLFHKRDEYSFSYEYNVMALIKNLEDFIYARNTKLRNMVINYPHIMPHKEESVFGIDAINVIYENLIKTRVVSNTHLWVIKEHIRVLKMIVLELSELCLVKDASILLFLICDIEKKSQIIINLCIKQQITNASTIISRIQELLEEIREGEKSIVYQLLKIIRKEEKYDTFNNLYFNAIETGIRAMNCKFSEGLFIIQEENSYVQVTFLGTGIICFLEAIEKDEACKVYLDGNEYRDILLVKKEIRMHRLPYAFHTIRSK